MATKSVSGFRTTSAERTRPLSNAGRICGESGCATRLSIYNDLDFCALHAPMVVPRMRGKVLDD
ncbi:MAG: hypothetical protein OEW42_05565 [Acidimicrobiia bacterium]|nr:hypothetical protein [Acidimicrobiia bacterium]MDH5237243.1 hypothetical protein [Acidimicrobiia bacterium]